MQLSEPVFPTPIYEVGMALVLLIILMLIRKKMPVWGMLFFVYLILNAITRYSIEAIRVNVRYSSFLNFTQAELISMGLLLVGVIGLAYLYINRERLGRKTVGAGKTA
jgi:phosphatidylglycerol:prolipoprotein diacylglycerol transferase